MSVNSKMALVKKQGSGKWFCAAVLTLYPQPAGLCLVRAGPQAGEVGLTQEGAGDVL